MFFIGYPKNSTKHSVNGWAWRSKYAINSDDVGIFILKWNQLSQFSSSSSRSILSRANGTSTEHGSSFRCNNQWSQGFYPSTDCTTSTPHHHRHHYPPQYNQQFANGGNPIHFNCRSTVPPPHGRLQKSLSFAFQTPMMNDPHHQSYQNQLNSINYPERSYSRWWTLNLLGTAQF